MRIKSSPLLYAIGIIYASLFGISHNNSDGSETKYIDATPYIIYPTVTTVDVAVTTVDVIESLAVETTKTTIPLPKEVPSDPNKRCPAFEHKFAEYNLPVETFSYIAWRESRCNPKAVNAKWDAKGNVIWTLNKNGSIDRGLVQINSSWKTVTKNVCGTKLSGLFNIDCNLKVAKYIMDNSVGKLNNWKISN